MVRILIPVGRREGRSGGFCWDPSLSFPSCFLLFSLLDSNVIAQVPTGPSQGRVEGSCGGCREGVKDVASLRLFSPEGFGRDSRGHLAAVFSPTHHPCFDFSPGG